METAFCKEIAKSGMQLLSHTHAHPAPLALRVSLPRRFPAQSGFQGILLLDAVSMGYCCLTSLSLQAMSDLALKRMVFVVNALSRSSTQFIGVATLPHPSLAYVRATVSQVSELIISTKIYIIYQGCARDLPRMR